MEKTSRLSLIINKEYKLGVRALFLTLSGVLTGLTIAFCELGFLEWITIVPAAFILLKRGSSEKIKLRSIYLDGLIFFYGFYLVCYVFFLSMYPLEFISGISNAAAIVVVAVAWLGLSLLQALMGALVFVISALVFRGGFAKKICLIKPLTVAALWAIFEWSQNFGWWGVPWGKLPIGQTNYLVGIQNASWLGSYFITFVLVLVNFLIALAIIELANSKIVKIAASLAVSLIIFQYASGAIIWFTTDINEGERIKIACVQGNISTGNSWDSTTMERIESIFWEQTRNAAEQGAEIVIWPETVIPYNITTGLKTSYDDKCKALALETQTYILVGAYSGDGEGGDYNSLICYTPEGERQETIYNKRRLVPFGEFVPLRAFFEKVIPPLTEILITYDDITPGSGANIIDIEGNSVGCLICFDSIYDYLTRETVREGADIICLSTNDSWFEGSPSIRIHNSHAQLRAIESGRYIARSASTGISTVISPRGEILGEIEAETEGILVYDLYTRENRNIWYYLGDFIVYVCIAFVGILIIGDIFVKINKTKIKKNKSY